MNKTTRTNYAFTVKEHIDGTPWIVLEPRGEEHEFFKKGVLGFDLPKGTTLDKAEEIARFLNGNLGDLSYTFLE